MIKDKITKAFEHCTPNNLNLILQECNKIERKNINMKKEKTKKIFKNLAYLTLGVLVGFVGLFGYQKLDISKIDSTVLLDVNPSIELDINRKNKVVKVNAINDDAKIILDNMNLKNVDLNIAINSLIGSMLKNGYLSELQNSVLVSVSSKSDTKSNELQTNLTNEINNILKSYNIDASVLSQTFNTDQNINDLSQKYSISVGKVKLINQIINKDQTLLFEDLANMPINELNLINNSKKVESKDIIVTGSANNKSYITEEKAKSIALNHANVKEENIYDYNIEFDSEKGILCYEVEFKTKSYEYDYDINAQNGSIVKNEKEVNDDLGNTNINDTTNNDNTANNNTTYITKEKAKAIVLSKLGFNSNEIREYDIELDKKDSLNEVDKYEISFKVNNYEYDAEVNAITGSIIKIEKEIDD